MHTVKKRLCSRGFGRIQELQSFARQSIVRRDFSGSSAGAGKDSRRTPLVHAGSVVSSAKLSYDGASSWPLRLRKPKLESLVRIGGLRRMGITARPGDRAAEHGVRNPPPNADGSPQRIEEHHQDEFLRGSKRAAALRVQQVEKAVGVRRGISFEVADAETRKGLRMNSADLVHETGREFTKRSEYHSTGSQPGAEVHYDGNLSDGIDEEVHRGLIADSEQPAGRVAVEDDQNFSSSEGEEGLITGSLSHGDLNHTEAEKDRTKKLYSTD